MSASLKPVENALIIDDDHVDQLLYKRIFNRSNRVNNVISFLDAKEALEYLKSPDRPKIDVIFLDIYMPKMNGFAFLDAIDDQLESELAAIIVMLSTSKDVDDIKRSEQYSLVKAYVNKPLTVEDVDAIVDKVVLNDT